MESFGRTRVKTYLQKKLPIGLFCKIKDKNNKINKQK